MENMTKADKKAAKKAQRAEVNALKVATAVAKKLAKLERKVGTTRGGRRTNLCSSNAFDQPLLYSLTRMYSRHPLRCDIGIDTTALA